MAWYEGLEPAAVWKWFAAVCAIPRPSGSESLVADFLVDFARGRGLEESRDGADNVLIRAAGSGPVSGGVPLLLQAHVDMVPERTAGSAHDFLTDGIVPAVEGDWVVSRETTLGADNGIGVALMLAVLDSPGMPHPPLECLFTTDEERGLTGAASLDPSWIRSRRMINLDSEEEGAFFIGCAGGVDLSVTMPIVREPFDGEPIEIRIEGPRGGHSGMAIVEGGANAVRCLARVLLPLCRDLGCRIVSLEGGSKRNAIPRTASASLIAPEGSTGTVAAAVGRVEADLVREYAGIEAGIRIPIGPAIPSRGGEPLAREAGLRAVRLLLALPHGVQKMSGVVPGLVETSINLAVVSTSVGALTASLSARSPLGSAKDAVADSVEALAALSGCSFSKGDGYPGWMPDPASRLLARCVAIHEAVLGRTPEVLTVHAGLECGIIGDRVGGMDMISMGPDIRDVHVPGERVSISSLGRFWRFFTALLADPGGTAP